MLTEAQFIEYSQAEREGRASKEQLALLEPYRVKRAIFLAAGLGSRMAPLTLHTPKPLVTVHGTRIIDTLLKAVVSAGIKEIYIIRGYLKEQFEALKEEYPQIVFLDNDDYDKANNISSAVCAGELLSNAYVFESDLLLNNPALVRKYEYESNFLGFPVSETDDWCLYADEEGYVARQAVGGTDCHQMVGISHWNAEDGKKLARDLAEVYRSEGGEKVYWEQVAFLYRKQNYRVKLRPCARGDVLEIDTYEELRTIDNSYPKLASE